MGVDPYRSSYLPQGKVASCEQRERSPMSTLLVSTTLRSTFLVTVGVGMSCSSGRRGEAAVRSCPGGSDGMSSAVTSRS
jgi:hypothetical protein